MPQRLIWVCLEKTRKTRKSMVKYKFSEYKLQFYVYHVIPQIPDTATYHVVGYFRPILPIISLYVYGYPHLNIPFSPF